MYYIIAPAEASSNLSRFDGVRYGHRAAEYTDLLDMYKKSRAEGFGPEVKRRILVGAYVLSHGYYDAYYLQAQKIRRIIAQDFQEAFKHCDVIMGPVAPSVAWNLGEKADDPVQMYLADIYTLSISLAGLPGMSVPCGFGAGRRAHATRPVGLQIIGNYFNEARMLQVADAFQRATDWHRAITGRSMSMSTQWEVVIGLETHAQLSTVSKIFSGAATQFGAEPNTQACPVDLALPGSLPVMNRGAVERAIRFGLAIGATIAPRSIFARKNYFYPDLPKGYQISQFEIPVVQGGSVTIQVPANEKAGKAAYEKTVNLTRAHLEEDAGKSLHEDFAGMTGIDLNRAGTPLLEIVTEPEMRSAAEAVAYAKSLHTSRAMARHLRRQHAGRLVPLRRERLRAPGRAGGIRHARRDQEPELVPLPRRSHPVRSAPADRVDRRRRHGRAGNASLRSGQARNALHAQQGRRARLPLFPRSGSDAARHRRSVDRARSQRIAGIAGSDADALRRAIRFDAVRRGGADVVEGNVGVFRKRGRRRSGRRTPSSRPTG